MKVSFYMKPQWNYLLMNWWKMFVPSTMGDSKYREFVQVILRIISAMFGNSFSQWMFNWFYVMFKGYVYRINFLKKRKIYKTRNTLCRFLISCKYLILRFNSFASNCDNKRQIFIIFPNSLHPSEKKERF